MLSATDDGHDCLQNSFTLAHKYVLRAFLEGLKAFLAPGVGRGEGLLCFDGSDRQPSHKVDLYYLAYEGGGGYEGSGEEGSLKNKMSVHMKKSIEYDNRINRSKI